jgi:hypothetical protein
MIVVLAIITVITSVALLGQSDFNRTLLLTDTTYQVALSVREMQSFGLSSKRYIGGAQDVQNAAYGIHIESDEPQQFILFADISRTPLPSPALQNCITGTQDTPDEKPGNCLYDTDATPDGIVETNRFTRGFFVSEFCGYNGGNNRYCSTDTATPLESLDIVFVRSSTESAIHAYRGSTWEPLVSAEIYISSADETASRGICISRVGQVSITQTTCP